MNYRRSVIVAMLGAVLLVGIAGCDLGTPPSGSRAIVAAHYLEKQRAKIQQIRSTIKSRALSRSTAQQ